MTEEPDVSSKFVSDYIILINGGIVFFMQAGFACLEAGTVRAKNVQHIMFKNVIDVAVGALVWYLIGWGFATGKGKNGFIGLSDFCLLNTDDYVNWFFAYAFCATSCTICSGSLAERVLSDRYLIFVVFMTGFIYPTCSFWVWNKDGWLSPGKKLGIIDWAGSGVVHMIGGFSGLIGTMITGPRIGRFEHDVLGITGHSATLQLLGTFILWFAWYGFNCGSTLTYMNQDTHNIGGKIAVNTTLSSCIACVSAACFTKYFTGRLSVAKCCNAIVGGLVAITAGCATMQGHYAIVTGFVANIVYFVSCDLLIRYKIDDPLEASSVHGFCGLWGVVAAGFFSSKEEIRIAYSGVAVRWLDRNWLERVGAQMVGSLIMVCWVVFLSIVIFRAIDYTVTLRVSPQVERRGLDCHHTSEVTLIVKHPATRQPYNVQVQMSETQKQVVVREKKWSSQLRIAGMMAGNPNTELDCADLYENIQGNDANETEHAGERPVSIARRHTELLFPGNGFTESESEKRPFSKDKDGDSGFE